MNEADGTNGEDAAGEPEPAAIEFALFLETIPPHVVRDVEGAFFAKSRGAGPSLVHDLARPNIRIECPRCEGPRRFLHMNPPTSPVEKGSSLHTMLYACVDCAVQQKAFGIRLIRADNRALAMKLGEYPAFGERVPPRVLKVLGGDAPLMLKGRQAENQGLGVGAFAYYRQVVERTKDRILKELRAAAERERVGADVLAIFDDALREHSFTAALDAVKLPASLQVTGQNPLKLLHDATSEGLHALTDEDCLERARAVRLVLVEMVRRSREVLEDRNDVDDAVRQLVAAQAKRNANDGG